MHGPLVASKPRGLTSPRSEAVATGALGSQCSRSTIYVQYMRDGECLIFMRRGIGFPFRCMTDMAAAGPDFFSPVPKLLRECCFLGRCLDVCGILMLMSVIARRSVYQVAHWVLFVFWKSSRQDCMLLPPRSMPNFRGDCVMQDLEIILEGVALSEREVTRKAFQSERYNMVHLQDHSTQEARENHVDIEHVLP